MWLRTLILERARILEDKLSVNAVVFDFSHPSLIYLSHLDKEVWLHTLALYCIGLFDLSPASGS